MESQIRAVRSLDAAVAVADAAQQGAHTASSTSFVVVFYSFHPLPPNLPLPNPNLPKHSLRSDPLFCFLSVQGHLVGISPSVAIPLFYLKFSGSLMLFYLRDDEELVDQKKYLEERCKPQCVKSLYEYEKCVKRVENDETGHKHCTGQYFDYWSCIDKCVAPKLLKKLK
nr:unnamed protein product [Digitaria exilis]